MKLLVSHESPIELLEDSVKYNDYHYALVHLLDQNVAYREFFLAARVRTDKEILLDNSIFELGESFDSERYVEWIEKLKPNYFIVPDVLQSYEGTTEKWLKFTRDYRKNIGSMCKIGAVQGKTWTDIVRCYRFMSEHADYIAISFDFDYYTKTGYGDTKLEQWCSGRQRLIKQLIDEGIWNWNKPHHLLGCSLAREFRYYVSNNIHNIRSCDTSNPIVAAINGLRYNGDLGLNTKPSTLLADLIEAEIDVDTRMLTSYNVEMFKRIIMR